MPQDPADDKSKLVQVMAWCRQATIHYWSQFWPRSKFPNGVTRPQWVKTIDIPLLLYDTSEESRSIDIVSGYWSCMCYPTTSRDVDSMHLIWWGWCGRNNNRCLYFYHAAYVVGEEFHVWPLSLELYLYAYYIEITYVVIVICLHV